MSETPDGGEPRLRRALLLAGLGAEGPPGEQARQRSVRGQIYRRLRRAIILGEIPPGSALSEKELAGMLGVSRTPVREALQQLAEDELVVIRPQQGTETARISARRVREAQLVRELLERSALAIAAQRPQPLPLGDLEQQLAAQEIAAKDRDYGAYFEADQQFHRSLASLSGFEGLGRIADAARVHLDRVRALSLPEPATMQHMADEHREMLTSLREGAVQAADELLQGHLRNVLGVLPLIQQRFPEYFVAEEADPTSAEVIAVEIALHLPGDAGPAPHSRAPR